MHKFKVFVFILTLLPVSGHSWGFFGHQWINQIAIYTLPQEMLGLFKHNLIQLVENSVKPDKRRYTVAEEGMRHFIDIDHYESELPLDSLPFSWYEAIEKYSEDTLMENGIGPWHVIRMKNWLTDAFIKGDQERIIRIASELGHYVADLHVPLHTTSNYNGQKTGQHGIHGLWESRIPELHFEQYDLLVDSAVYISDIQTFIWDQVAISHSLVDSVLWMERMTGDLISPSDKYSFGQRGSRVIKNYSEKYAGRYNEYLNGMIERRFRDAVFAVGSIWFTAWVDAGQPGFNTSYSEEQNRTNLKLVNDSLRKTMKMIGREEAP